MSLKKELKHARPSLSDSSIVTYNSLLCSLYKKVFDDDDLDVNKFDETKKVLDFMKDLPPNRRKTVLSALVVISNKPEYRKIMLEDVNEYNKEMSTQQKTETQEKAWLSDDDINGTFSKLKDNANTIYKKKSYTTRDLQDLQDYIILCMLSGIFIPPRRSLDYTEFKIKNIDKDTDNYLDKNELAFNSYKTAKYYGLQKIEIPKELKTILAKWLKVNPTDYLLFDINNNKLTSVKLNQRLHKIFGKASSVNALRHSYLTSKYGDTIKTNNSLSTDLIDMGSSISQAKVYIKE